MANNLTITKTLTNDHWDIEFAMGSGTLPAEIFVCLNTATNVLGTFQGICNLDQLSRLQIFVGIAIPIFGNKYVRTNNIKISVPLTTDPTLVISTTTASINLLSTAYKNQANTTQVISIL